MSSPKIYSISIIAVYLLISGGGIIFSLTFDPHSVFRGPSDTTDFQYTNERVVKYNYLNSEEGKDFRAFTFGNSISNCLSPTTAEKIFEKSFYGYWSLHDNPIGIEKKIRWLTEKNRINTAIIALDYDFLLKGDKGDSQSLVYKNHPALTDEHYIKFYSHYLFPKIKVFKLELYKLFLPISEVTDDLITFSVANGSYKYINRDQLFDKSKIEFAQKYTSPLPKEFKRNPNIKIDKNQQKYYSYNIQALVNIKKMIGENNVEAHFVINPHYIYRQLINDGEHYYQYLTDLVKILGNVWFFDGINRITTSPYNYYDDSHYRCNVGDEILQTIAGINIRNQKFGLLLNEHNLAETIYKIRQNKVFFETE